jgi:ABC-type transporter lipoprotein component MlaA
MTIQGEISNQAVQVGLTAAGSIDGRVKLLPYDKSIDTAFDPYGLVRNIWFQRREHKVRGNSAPEVLLPDPNDE